MEAVITKIDKQQTYKVLMAKQRSAVHSDFYFESCLISYAILEDRLSALLYYSGLKSVRNDEDKIYAKIKCIRNNIEKNNKLVSKHVSLDLIDRIDLWRIARNAVIHQLTNLEYDSSSMRELATDGYNLTKEIGNKVACIRRAYEKTCTQ